MRNSGALHEGRRKHPSENAILRLQTLHLVEAEEGALLGGFAPFLSPVDRYGMHTSLEGGCGGLTRARRGAGG
jgi:hypothetical protein